MRWQACVLGLAAAAATGASNAAQAPAPACRGTIYLTFDTGSQSQADLIASVLARQNVKATFFLANEKTVKGDYSLDPSWQAYWRARVAEGHAFGSHTFDHTYYLRDAANGKITVKPQFGPRAGKPLDWTPQQYCEELRRVDQRFHQLTGKALDPFWRAPGGKTSPRTWRPARPAATSTPAGPRPPASPATSCRWSAPPTRNCCSARWTACATATSSWLIWASGRARILGRRPTWNR